MGRAAGPAALAVGRAPSGGAGGQREGHDRARGDRGVGSGGAGGAGDQWGLLLAKGSPLTECVNLAIDTLTSTGELRDIILGN